MDTIKQTKPNNKTQDGLKEKESEKDESLGLNEQPFGKTKKTAYSPQLPRKIVVREEVVIAEPETLPGGTPQVATPDTAGPPPVQRNEVADGLASETSALTSAAASANEVGDADEESGADFVVALDKNLNALFKTAKNMRSTKDMMRRDVEMVEKAYEDVGKNVLRRLKRLELELIEARKEIRALRNQGLRLQAAGDDTGATPKRVRDSPGETRPGGAKRKATDAPVGKPRAGASYAMVAGGDDWQKVERRGRPGEARAPSEQGGSEGTEGTGG